ncbi:MAG: CDP-glycerol glycerophosphotransferase family protein [Actinomycetales bacterium]|nr:CDP-glycerol glycerophosphotransferase family protein [Actinomycetales bacterium]
MSVLSDARAALRLVRNALRSRASRRRVAALVEAGPLAPPAPGSIEIAVYFADTRVNLYQIRQWYAPLAALAPRHPVAIVTRSPGTALTLVEESPVPVVYARRVTDLEEFVHAQRLRLVLYVNQNQKNFQMFRYGRMWHVFVNHGESDKMYMTTNQFKAYDYALVAGQAALDRLSRALWDYDVAAKAIPIGRPQADHFAGAVPYPRDGRTVVLYAPTWEGDRPAASYGSIASHGEAIAAAVLASPVHRLVYRPHPRSGVVDREYRDAHRRIVAAIAAANAADPAARHVYDDGPELGWQLADADVAITDISAMVYDRLATGRPLLIARPASPDAVVDEAGYLGVAEWLDAADAGGVLAQVTRLLDDPEAQAATAHWSRHHFGDTTPGAATERFHAAVDELVARWEEHAARHAGDPEAGTDEHDPLDDEDDEATPEQFLAD